VNIEKFIFSALVAAGRELETEHDWSCFDGFEDNKEESNFVQVIYSHMLPYIDLRKVRFERMNELRKELAELENAGV
jgi:hypothetical protein